MKKLFFAFILALFATVAMAQPSLKEGIKMLDNENYKGALDQFNAIAKADPKNGTIYFYIGEVSYLQDDAMEAEKAYKKGLNINSQCAECKVGLGKILLDQGKDAEAQDYFESAMRLDKKNPDIFAMVGEAYLETKHPDANKAARYLGNARDMNPKVASYWAHLGDAYEMLGDNGQAMTNYETAVAKDPSNTSAYISIAHIWTGAKLYDTAIVYLQKAIQLSPNDAAPYKDLIELYIRTNQYDKVTPLLTKYTQLTGDDIDAKVRLVKFLTFQAKDYDRAIKEGESLLKTNPEQYTLHRWLAWSYGEKGMAKESYDHSKMLFDEIAKNKDRKAYASDYEYMARASMKLGDIDEAAHIYRKYIEIDTSPERAHEIYGILAKAYYDVKNYEQSAAYLLRKGNVKPLSVTDNYYLAVSYYLSDKDLKADSCFAIYLEAVPTFAQGWLYRAKIAISQDTTDPVQYLAKPYYTQYILYAKEDMDKNKKGLNDAYMYMGVYHAQTDSLDLAMDDFKKVLEIDSTNEDALHFIEILKEHGKGGR